ncbi:helix-turn-helix domain-containing protein, partial [Megamonas hypermegale]|uniref:helix-turn-helix domain-containing protein n=1 Tax=Megamonas hypermegale TaxID=158847 RepID=UPI001959AFD7
CGTSPTVLKDAFRAEFGTSVYEWARRRRMIAAAKLLVRTSASVAEGARAVGYANPAKFARAFEACLRMSPSAFRARYGRRL